MTDELHTDLPDPAAERPQHRRAPCRRARAGAARGPRPGQHRGAAFSDFDIKPEIVDALEDVGIERTFAIQELTLPIALAGNDLIGQARTGTGKTLGLRRPAAQPARPCPAATARAAAGAGRRADPRARGAGVRRPRRAPARSSAPGCSPSTAAGPTSRRSRRCARASTSSSARPGGCSTSPSRATWYSANVAHPRARRGRRDARPRLPARHREAAGAWCRPQRQTMLFSATMPGPIVALARTVPASSPSRSGPSTATRDAEHRPRRPVRLPRALHGQGRAAGARSCRPATAA